MEHSFQGHEADISVSSFASASESMAVFQRGATILVMIVVTGSVLRGFGSIIFEDGVRRVMLLGLFMRVVFGRGMILLSPLIIVCSGIRGDLVTFG